MKNLEENAKLQKEVINKFEIIVKTLEKEKNDLAGALNAKEQQLHEMKVKNNECQNGCNRYSKSIDEIYKAGSKHKEKLLALKLIADNQKKKITSLQADKAHLNEQVQQLEDDVVIGQNIVRKQSAEKERLYYSMKDHEKQLLVKEEVMKQYQENNKAVETKVEFLKGRLETTMRNYQDLDKNTRLEIDALKDELKLANIKSVEDANFDESIKESDSVKKDVHDEVVKDFNLQIEYLRNRGNDIEDELAIKYEEVEVLKETIQQNTLKASMKSTSSSLAEELDHASIELETSTEHIEMNPRPFESVHLLVVCKHCSLTFSTIADLKEHQRKLKQEQMEQKLEKLNQISMHKSSQHWCVKPDIRKGSSWI